MTVDAFRSTPRTLRDTRRNHLVGWAVRRDWPIDGTHEFIRFHADLATALRQAARDVAYWHLGPVRPQVSVAYLSRHEFWLHARARRGCRAPDCPAAAVTPRAS